MLHTLSIITCGMDKLNFPLDSINGGNKCDASIARSAIILSEYSDKLLIPVTRHTNESKQTEMMCKLHR